MPASLRDRVQVAGISGARCRRLRPYWTAAWRGLVSDDQAFCITSDEGEVIAEVTFREAAKLVERQRMLPINLLNSASDAP